MKKMVDDPSPMYSGAIMQLALQHGLHMFTKGEVYVGPAAFREIAHDAFMARVWAYLEFVCYW